MTSINDVFGGTTLKPADLQGKTVSVEIERFEVHDFDDGKKIILSFKGKEKVLVCNKTNARTIAEIHGEQLEGWVGKTIQLFPTQTDFQGSQVACIRVVMTPPPERQPGDEAGNDIPF